jgi:hypothetical protein
MCCSCVISSSKSISQSSYELGSQFPRSTRNSYKCRYKLETLREWSTQWVHISTVISSSKGISQSSYDLGNQFPRTKSNDAQLLQMTWEDWNLTWMINSTNVSTNYKFKFQSHLTAELRCGKIDFPGPKRTSRLACKWSCKLETWHGSVTQWVYLSYQFSVDSDNSLSSKYVKSIWALVLYFELNEHHTSLCHIELITATLILQVWDQYEWSYWVRFDSKFSEKANLFKSINDTL